VSSQTELDIAFERCRATLRQRPSGLLTDIDGTISLIAPTPDTASVTDEAKVALHRLSKRLAVVGVVTGRAAADAESMIGVPELLHVGNHGLEWRYNGIASVDPEAVGSVESIASAIESVERDASQIGLIDGIIYENKGVTGSIHFRLAPDQDRAHDVLLSLARSSAMQHGLKVTEGRMVIELRPVLATNKGTAVRRIIAESRLAGVVFLGDDLTDVDAFRVVTQLRTDGKLAGANIAVSAPETHPDVMAAADAVLHGVESSVELLTALANAFDGIEGAKG
jgi:trehalose 6-phosphate phosphatase